jgi:hypothetical protein
MAYFGWPAAHDNDAERAARAGLAILDAIAKLNEQPRHARLSARIGIDSGPVVVANSAGHDVDVFGDTPAIAARVQDAAEPGSVAISDATHRLVSGLFVVEDRGVSGTQGYRASDPSLPRTSKSYARYPRRADIYHSEPEKIVRDPRPRIRGGAQRASSTGKHAYPTIFSGSE